MVTAARVLIIVIMLVAAVALGAACGGGRDRESDTGRDAVADQGGPADEGSDLGAPDQGGCPGAGGGAGCGCTAEVEAGGEYTCIRRKTGSLWCWGNNEKGQLGDGTMSAEGSLDPVKVIGTGDGVATVFPDVFVDLAAGWRHTCARSKDDVWCWGDNTLDMLGDGTNMSSGKAVRVMGVMGVVETTAGNTHTCARTAGGDVYCWGINTFGQLGVKIVGGGITPVPVKSDLDGVAQIGAGGDTTCAVKSDGSLLCFGMNLHGELGNGMTAMGGEAVPQKVALADVAMTSGGTYFSCAVTKGGDVYCWGDNFYQTSGAAMPATVPSPAKVPGLPAIAALDAGANHVCALSKDGRVFCWGRNDMGQSGGGSTSVAPAPPTEVKGLKNIVQVSAGVFHSCAIDDHAVLFCWGGNTYGQLGDRSKTPSPLPIEVKAACP